MKIEKHKQKKWIIITAIFTLLIAGGIAGAVYYMNRSQPVADSNNEPDYTRKIDLEAATNDQQKAGNDIKKDSIEKDQEAEQQEPTQNIPVNITAANQNSGTLQIRSLIESIVSDGTCTLTLSRDGKQITKTSGVQTMSSSSTCQGFDVPVAELSAGTWTVTLNVSTEGRSGVATRTVTIQ